VPCLAIVAGGDYDPETENIDRVEVGIATRRCRAERDRPSDVFDSST
jgi:hypothetical protein